MENDAILVIETIGYRNNHLENFEGLCINFSTDLSLKTIVKIVTFMLATNGHNELHQCKELNASYVKRVVHGLNVCFSNPLVFNTVKFFEPT